MANSTEPPPPTPPNAAERISHQICCVLLMGCCCCCIVFMSPSARACSRPRMRLPACVCSQRRRSVSLGQSQRPWPSSRGRRTRALVSYRVRRGARVSAKHTNSWHTTRSLYTTHNSTHRVSVINVFVLIVCLCIIEVCLIYICATIIMYMRPNYTCDFCLFHCHL